MAAGINDKFKKVSADNSYAVATTVKTARTVGGGTTLEAFDLSKWADQTAVNFLTYRKTTDPVTNIATVTNRTGWTALVNTGSNTLTNLTIAPGYTDLGHQVGDYIEPVQMSKWANDLVDGILVTHNQDGTLKNKVATLGKIHGGSTDGVLLTDASGNVTGGKVTSGKLDLTTLAFENFSTTEVDTGLKDHLGAAIYTRTFTGTITQTAGGRNSVSLLTLTSTARVLSADGYWEIGGGFSTYNLIGGYDSAGRSSAVDVAAGVIRLITTSEQARTAAPYMVRVLYTKV